MRPKRPGRVKFNARELTIRSCLRLLQAADDGLLFFEGTYRHRRIAISQGMEGLRRAVKGREVRAAAQRLRAYRRRGYMIEKKIGSRRALALTERGKLMKLRLELRSAVKRRDGKLLVIVFDVPETQAGYRQTLRSALRSCGFNKLQQSVWVTDAAAEKPLTDWVNHLGAEDWIRLFLAETL